MASVNSLEMKNNQGSSIDQKNAEKAKSALIAYIRDHRKEFIGDPDPEKLNAIPLTHFDEHGFALGRFVIDLKTKSFQAMIGEKGPEPYFYEGDFKVQEDGNWVVEKINLTRIHKKMEK